VWIKKYEFPLRKNEDIKRSGDNEPPHNHRIID
jgi:hypothetical protein